jgi:hypothetical protein
MNKPEIAKKLKEAGFPQFLYLGANYWRDGIAYEVMTDLTIPYESDRNILDPSIEDLIFRCAQKEGKNSQEEVEKVKQEWVERYLTHE